MENGRILLKNSIIWLSGAKNRQLRCCKWLEGYGKAKQDVLIQYQAHQSPTESWEPIEITKNVSHLLNVKLHIVGAISHLANDQHF